MSDLSWWLQRLEEQLAAQGARTLGFASPGLSEDEIATTLDEVGLAAPAEVLTWRGWRDGSVRDGGWQHRRAASIAPFLQPSLAESVAYRANQRAQARLLGPVRPVVGGGVPGRPCPPGGRAVRAGRVRGRR